MVMKLRMMNMVNRYAYTILIQIYMRRNYFSNMAYL